MLLDDKLILAVLYEQMSLITHQSAPPLNCGPFWASLLASEAQIFEKIKF